MGGFAVNAIQKVVQPLNCLLFEKFSVHMRGSHMGCPSYLILRMTLFHLPFTLIKVLNGNPTRSFGFFILQFKHAKLNLRSIVWRSPN